MRRALALAFVLVLGSCKSEPAPAKVDAATDVYQGPAMCAEAGASFGYDAGSATLATACGLGAQECDPLGSACACDLAQGGYFACFAEGPGALGDACDPSQTCKRGLTCARGRCAKLCCADTDCASGACAPLEAMRASGGHVGTCALASDAGAPPTGAKIGNHAARYEGRGFLVPWTSFGDALARELAFYDGAPKVGPYPIWATAVHLDGTFTPTIDDAIPAMSNGTGVLSYLAAYAHGGRSNPALLATARALADYLIDQASTPANGAYPFFPRSTGKARAVPQAPDCGTQADRPYEIEPDKGALAAYAYALLGKETGDAKYTTAATRVAQALASNMRDGDGERTPWPFRADYRTGEARGNVSSNLSFALRLFDEIGGFEGARARLWRYIKDWQIPNARCDGFLWSQFFEDAAFDLNRNAWAPLSTARYLLEKQSAVDPEWRYDVETLLAFVESHFIDDVQGFRVCIEQDLDRKPFGGILSNYAATMARFAKVTGDARARLRAYQALTLLVYAIDDDGCPRDRALDTGRGGWQEDAHTDKVHNFLDAFSSFPDWEN